MAIGSGGALGTGANSTSNSGYTFNTATNTLVAGDFALLVSVSDNTSTADGSNNEHTGVTGLTGAWSKLGEYTNTVGGAAGDGVTASLWLFKATGTVNTGSTVTLNFGSNRADKCCSFWKFTKASGYDVRLDTAPATNPLTNGVDASNGFGSSAFSGLASAVRLFFRGLGKEANSTTDITVSSNFTGITATRSRNNAAAQLVRGEFRINTSTGETSNPTLAVSGDTAAVFAALVEYLPDIAGTLGATETGSGTLASDGNVFVTGNAAATEIGADGFGSYGRVEVFVRFGDGEHPSGGYRFGSQLYAEIVSGAVTGDLSAAESSADSFGAIGALVVIGALSASEFGTELLSSAGVIEVSGGLACSESGADTLASTGSLLISGGFSVVDAIDALMSPGTVAIAGDLNALEDTDMFTAAGAVTIAGAFGANESGGDAASAAGTLLISGNVVASESAADALGADGGVVVSGDLSAIETDTDTILANGSQSVIGHLAAFESGDDVLAADGVAPIAGDFIAYEPTPDATDILGAVLVLGSCAIIETNSDLFVSAGGPYVTGAAGLREGDPDILSIAGGIEVIATAMMIETGEDSFTASGARGVIGSLNVIDAADRFMTRGIVTHIEGSHWIEEFIYIGRNNVNVVRIAQDKSALDFSGITRMVMRLDRSPIAIDSAIHPDAIKWQHGGSIKLSLGSLPIKAGRYWVTLLAYDGVRDDAQIVVDMRDAQLSLRFIST